MQNIHRVMHNLWWAATRWCNKRLWKIIRRWIIERKSVQVAHMLFIRGISTQLNQLIDSMFANSVRWQPALLYYSCWIHSVFVEVSHRNSQRKQRYLWSGQVVCWCSYRSMPCSFILCLSDINRPPPHAAWRVSQIQKHKVLAKHTDSTH